jgi:hypothetical protein
MKDNDKQNIGQFPNIEIKNWEEFEEKVAKPALSKKHLYRGHTQSDWKLESTLYRKSPDVLVLDYRKNAYYALKMLESMTEIQWNLSIDDFAGLTWYTNWDILFSDKQIETEIQKQEFVLEFLAYLRHHGYPSPLLDWTNSPYVAAFFAFYEETKSDEVAVIQYQEYGENGRRQREDSPHKIQVYNHSLRTHKRHYLQHSAYMLSRKREGDRYWFSSIEQALFQSRSPHPEQDVVTKYIMPSSLRISFLKKLDLMNINHMTLFSDEWAMIKTLEMRQFDFKKIN